MNSKTDIPEYIEWTISVPIFKDPLILKQLGIGIGIPFGILVIVLALVGGKSVYTLYALGLIAALFFVTWILIMLLYRGKYDAEFVLDDNGIICRTQAEQAKKNRIVNALAVILGLLTGKFTVAGAGMLAQSRQETFLKWKSITKLKYRPKNNTILLRAGWIEQIALFCTQENYAAVELLVVEKTKHLRSDHMEQS